MELVWDSLGNRVVRESTTSSTVSSLFFWGTRNELQRLKLLVHHHCLHTAATRSTHPSSCSPWTPKIGSFFPCYSAMRTCLVMSFQSSSALFVLFRTTTTVAFFAFWPPSPSSTMRDVALRARYSAKRVSRTAILCCYGVLLILRHTRKMNN